MNYNKYLNLIIKVKENENPIKNKKFKIIDIGYEINGIKGIPIKQLHHYKHFRDSKNNVPIYFENVDKKLLYTNRIELLCTYVEEEYDSEIKYLDNGIFSIYLLNKDVSIDSNYKKGESYTKKELQHLYKKLNKIYVDGGIYKIELIK